MFNLINCNTMKKRTLQLALVAVAMLFSFSAFAQEKAVRTITDPVKGTSFEYGKALGLQKSTTQTTDVDVLWEYHEPYAVAQEVNFIYGNSTKSNKAVVNWQLNDQRITQYDESGDIVWEVPTTASFTHSYVNKAGNLAVITDDNVLRAVNPATGDVVWTLTLASSCSIRYAIPSPSGERVYVGASDDGGSFYRAYTVGNDTPIWSVDAPTSVVIMAMPGDESKLMVCFGSDIKKAYIVDPETGETLQDDIYYYSNSPTQAPGMSADGEYMVVTDFSGNATLFRWDGTRYNQQWSTSVSGPGASSTWGAGSAISADGSTIVVGTLDFVSTGSGYDGCLFVFNNYSSTPIWMKSGLGDEVSSVDVTDDGSLIVAGTWGPMNHTTPDFYAFRRQSPEPITTLNTTGAVEFVDLSADGSRCIMGGKGVHPREYGYGGQAYYVDPRPANSGALMGVVDLVGTDDDSGVTITIEGIEDYYTLSLADGSFGIKYIPAGTYNVKATLPGYQTYTWENVEIVADETIQLNGQMEAVGTPISDLFASQYAYDYVKLYWTPSAEPCLGYRIYRKSSLDAPFDAPIATIGTEADYIDEDVVPTECYYYAVTVLLDENQETPYSNIAIGYPSTTNIVYEVDVYDGAAPTIDGEMTEGEWDDAFRIDVTNYLLGNPFGSVVMYFKQDNDYLYVCSENHLDTSWDDNDGVAMYIDDNNDGSFPESGDDSEGNYWMYYGASGNTVRFRPIYNTGGVGTVVNLPEEIIACSMSQGYEVIEFALPFGTAETWQIDPSANQSGLYLFVRNAETAAMDGKWPADNEETFAPTYYGVMNYHAIDAVPDAPQNLRVNEEVLGSGQYAPLSWDMPAINDLDHFNIYLNGNTVTNETSGTQVILDVEENTAYSVYVTTVDDAGQESVPSETLTFTSGNVNVMEAEASTFSLYPNPAKSVLTITSAIEGQGEVKVMDITGRIVKAFTSSDLTCTQVQVSDFDKGIYFVVVNYGNTLVVRKFVVE